MQDLQYYLDNLLEENVMDVTILLPDGSEIDVPNYSDFLVVNAKYETKEDGFKYCTINVKPKY